MNRFATADGGVELQTPPSTKGTNGAAPEPTAPGATLLRPGQAESHRAEPDGAAKARHTQPKSGGGRAEDGKFAKGYLGGPGNPFARQTAALRKALISAVTDDDIQAIAVKLLEQAREGDVASAKLLLSYTIGKPDTAVNPDTLDLHEWSLVKQAPVDLEQLKAAMSGLPVDTVCTLLRYVMPCVSANASGVLSEAIQTGDVSSALERLAPRPQSKYAEEFEEQPAQPRRTADKPKRTDPSAGVKTKPSTKGPNGGEEAKDPDKRRRAELLTRTLRQQR